jgi:chloramphenicol 3-O-phosphotransferase
MKSVSTYIQIVALSTCFAVHTASVGESNVAGMRRAIQTLAGWSNPIAVLIEAAVADAASPEA